jgi:DNA-binding NarL/FixJ family response regulator
VAEVSVLIVDDQEPFRRAIAAVVAETDGFAVVGSTATGEEALLATVRLRPELVLMDVNLPGIDGIEATRRITHDADPPVVVLLSTYDQDEFDVSTCGAASYLAKAAFGPDLLAAAWDAATNQPIQPAPPTDRATPPAVQAHRRRSEC